MGISVKVFPASNGDAFLIKTNKDRSNTNILIDGGKGLLCHVKLKQEIEKIVENKENIDLLVLTHIDDDHISGILKLYEDNEVDKSIIKMVWFNSGTLLSEKLNGKEIASRGIPLIPLSKKMSVKQGVTFENELKKGKAWFDDIITSGLTYVKDNIRIDVLSPDIETLKDLNYKWEKEVIALAKKRSKKRKASFTVDYQKSITELCEMPFEEDSSLFNKSSIAFLLEYDGQKLLMLADSHPSVIVTSLKKLGYSRDKKLVVDVVKVSHHGSKKNTSYELLEMLDCENFIISSDGSRHGLPNKESLSRIICTLARPINFYFNYYSMKNIFTPQECEMNNIKCFYLSEENNFTFPIRD